MNVRLLKIKMLENDMTQTTLAHKIGISPQSLSRKLCGKRDFRLDEVVKICDCLRIENPKEIFLQQSSQKCNEIHAPQNSNVV